MAKLTPDQLGELRDRLVKYNERLVHKYTNRHRRPDEAEGKADRIYQDVLEVALTALVEAATKAIAEGTYEERDGKLRFTLDTRRVGVGYSRSDHDHRH